MAYEKYMVTFYCSISLFLYIPNQVYSFQIKILQSSQISPRPRPSVTIVLKASVYTVDSIYRVGTWSITDYPCMKMEEVEKTHQQVNRAMFYCVVMCV